MHPRQVHIHMPPALPLGMGAAVLHALADMPKGQGSPATFAVAFRGGVADAPLHLPLHMCVCVCGRITRHTWVTRIGMMPHQTVR